MEQEILRILLIEDNEGDVFFFRDLLERKSRGFIVNPASRLSEGLAMMEETHFDLVLLDLGLPDEQGLSTFERFYDAHPDVPVVILTGFEDLDSALSAMRKGAQDYLSKNEMDKKLLVRSIKYAMERHRLLMELKEAQESIRTLTGLLPICSVCKNIRDDKGYWQKVETFISDKSDIHFSHSMCPDCIRKLYPDMAEEILSQETD